MTHEQEAALAEAQATAQSKLNELYQEQEVAFATLRRAIEYARGLQAEHRVTPLLNARETRLREAWTEIVATDKLIRSLAKIVEQSHRGYFKHHRLEEIEGEFISSLDQLSIWKYEVQQAQQVRVDPAPGSVAAANTHLKLQRSSIPQFSGKITEWVPFRDSFIALVKSNASLSDVEKLHHLKASAKGEANEIICSVQLANGNFNTAWTLLEARYENKRVAVNAHLAEIFKIESINRESAPSLLNLRNVVNRNLAALQNLGCPTEHYGAILVHVLTEKLDQQTQRDWELSNAVNNNIPTFNDLDTFLLERIRVLDSLSPAELLKQTSQLNVKSSAQSQAKSHTKSKPLVFTSYVTQPKNSCVVCTQDHKIYQCTKFKKIPVTERYDYVRSLNLCSNCLGKGHKRNACPSTGSCRQCAQKQHTMLHRDSPRGDTSNTSMPQSQEVAKLNNKQSFATHLSIQNPLSSTKILLATAKIWVSSDKNRKIQVRALLDQGSTWSFVSSKLAAALGAQRTQVSVAMTGLGGAPTGATSSAIDIKLLNQNQQDVCCTQALVIPQITSYSTDCAVPINNWSHIENLQLADDLTNTGQIDLLIGADLYGLILLNEIRKGKVHEPVAQRTVFGWVLFGPCSSTNQGAATKLSVHHSISAHNLDAALQKFWEIESIPSQKVMSPEDQHCESYFTDTHSRDADGRYIVRIPFKLNKTDELGQSRSIAENLLTKIETRLARHPEQKILYDEFMLEYQSLNHMTPVSRLPLNQTPIVYLPHHPIIRNESQTTKLRVVFNASCKTSSSISLNDCMLTGPKLQSELFVILSQWRSYPLVFVADIAKMYRQILVDSRDRDFQRILWRQSTDCSPTDYQLNTVTYGTRSAPYLALRVIKQLVVDEGAHFPLASTVLTHDTFVDDLLFGAYDERSALAVRNEVIALLGKAQLQPRKWASNHPELVVGIDPSNHGLSWSSLSHEKSGVKVLGLEWHPATDSFSFSININLPSSLSKQQVLSLLSQLFDPLGWVSPVILKGKILMQKLWLCQVQWDDILPEPLSHRLLEFFESLTILSQIQIPRWNNLQNHNQSSQLHGFSDTSNDAYGATVYLRTVTESGHVQIALIMSKTKVSPLKQVSVHRLELQAALLLARLIAALCEVRAFAELPIQCWTDSSITLSWLRKHSSTWKLFVANRVAEIHELLPNHQWRLVPTLSNPADLASRGCAPSDLINCSLWWHGAEWLSKEPNEWPNTFPEPPPDDALKLKL